MHKTGNQILDGEQTKHSDQRLPLPRSPCQNLCIGVVQIRKGLNGVWCIALGNVAKGVAFLIYLRRNVSDMYLKNMNRYSLRHSAVFMPEYLMRVLHPGTDVRGSIAGCSEDDEMFPKSAGEAADKKFA